MKPSEDTISVTVNGMTLTLEVQVIKDLKNSLLILKEKQIPMSMEHFKQFCEVLEKALRTNDCYTPAALVVISDEFDVEELDEIQMAELGWVRSRPTRTMGEIQESLISMIKE